MRNVIAVCSIRVTNVIRRISYFTSILDPVFFKYHDIAPHVTLSWI